MLRYFLFNRNHSVQWFILITLQWDIGTDTVVTFSSHLIFFLRKIYSSTPTSLFLFIPSLKLIMKITTKEGTQIENVINGQKK